MFLSRNQGQAYFHKLGLYFTSQFVSYLQHLVESGSGTLYGCLWDVHQGPDCITSRCLSRHHMSTFPSWVIITHTPGWSQEVARDRHVRGKCSHSSSLNAANIIHETHNLAEEVSHRGFSFWQKPCCYISQTLVACQMSVLLCVKFVLCFSKCCDSYLRKLWQGSSRLGWQRLLIRIGGNLSRQCHSGCTSKWKNEGWQKAMTAASDFHYVFYTCFGLWRVMTIYCLGTPSYASEAQISPQRTAFIQSSPTRSTPSFSSLFLSFQRVLFTFFSSQHKRCVVAMDSRQKLFRKRRFISQSRPLRRPEQAIYQQVVKEQAANCTVNSLLVIWVYLQKIAVVSA